MPVILSLPRARENNLDYTLGKKIPGDKIVGPPWSSYLLRSSFKSLSHDSCLVYLSYAPLGEPLSAETDFTHKDQII